MTQVVQGILIPFLGTTLGAACALFLKNNLPTSVQRILTGFAAGIMTAASVWSLLIPALEQESDRGRLAFLPAAIGFLVGIAFLLLLDRLIPHLHMNSKEAEGIPARLKKTTMLVFAVTLHNIPEGMAVGVVYAGVLYGHQASITAAGALALSLGIAIQQGSPSRTFRRGQLFQCHCVQKVCGSQKRFYTVRCPALSNRWEHC